MGITSLNFAGFMVVVLATYYLLPRRPQNYWLLLASFAFYVTWAWQFAIVLLVLTLVNFLLAQELDVENQNRRFLLWTVIGLNILALAFFKYADFFVPGMLTLLARLGVKTGAGGVQVLLPVGLSFYVLQAISYQVDVYRRQMPAASDLVDFALYMAYFPKLVSGPIERARSFLPKLAQQRVIDNEALARSFTLIVVGTVRKVVIADLLAAMIPDKAFKAPLQFAAPELAVYLLGYAFSLYNDFAGYTDIARGVSGLFGIELSVNFQQPFFARNFVEFWNRWHITLSHWLRDYIYFPLSRALVRRNLSRRNFPNLVLPPMATMLASGLWHGANWHMVLWGGIHGLYQVVERIPSLWRPMVPPQKQPLWRQGSAMVVVFVLAVLSFIPFRMDLPVAWAFWRGLFAWTHWTMPELRVFVVIIPALGLDWVQYRRQDPTVFLRWPRLAQATLLACAILTIFLVTQSDAGVPFVYQGF